MSNGYGLCLKRCLAGCLIFGLATALSARAEDNNAAASPQKEPGALSALVEMGSYLRSLKFLQLSANSNTDQVLDDGQTVQFNHRFDIDVIQPNKLKMRASDGHSRRSLYFDGKQFVLFDEGQGYYATGPAPSTVDGLLDDMHDRYGIEIPLTDLFRWDSDSANTVGISSALYIDQQVIDGQTCAHYAYRQPDADWQIWIRQGKQPLPCQLVIIRQDVAGRPRHTVVYHWNTQKAPMPGVFHFTPPTGTKAVPLREIKPEAQAVQP